jgi:HSP20 family protein
MFRQNLPDRLSASDEGSYFPSFQREMNRLIDQFRNGFPIPEAGARTGFGAEMFPAIDVVETDETIEISAEVPGVSEKDLDASVSGGVLTLKGEKSSEHEENEDNYHRFERRYGSFRRQIPLGFTPKDGAVEAKYSDGVLKLTIAKPPAVKADIQKIDIGKS